MKLKIFLLALIAFPAISQTTYTSSKYKPVWYSSTYEKTHGTYALFDTSSIKLSWTTSGKPEMKFFGPTGNTLFYVDSTGTISPGVVTGGLLKADFGDSLLNYEGWGIDVVNNDNIHVDSVQVPSIYMHNLKLARASFDDSLNNAHTVTGAWKFSGNVGVIPAGQVSIGKNAGDGYLKLTADDNDTLILVQTGSSSNIKSSQYINFYAGTNQLSWDGTNFFAPVVSKRIGAIGFPFTRGYFADSLLVGGKGEDAVIWWGQSKQQTISDSCGVLTMASGNPVISLYATDADNYTQSINTYDQAVFTGASGGYIFDSMIRNRDTDSDTFAVNPKGFSPTNTMATGATALQLKDGATNLFSVDTVGNTSLAGDLTYGFIHFVGSADSVAVTPTVAQYLYTKLLPGIITHEADGVTFAADSLTVLTAGDYACFISITLSGTNANDYWRIKTYKNNAALPNTGENSVGRFVFRTTANNQTDTREFVWYFKDLAINDVLSWRITNLSAARNPTVTDMKLYFYKLPEQ